VLLFTTVISQFLEFANKVATKVFWLCIQYRISYIDPMKPQLVTIEGTTRPSQERSFWASRSLARAGALVCVLLVFLTSFVAVAHFHPNDLGSTGHPCSLCALAHAGIALNEIAQPAPIFAPSILARTPAVTRQSFLPALSNYIRPPPQA
jgi:hypothetical protein